MKIFSNLAISLDGKIAQADEPLKALGTPLDRKTMELVRKKADVILVGANTLRANSRAMLLKKDTLKKGQRHPAMAVLSQSGQLDRDAEFWKRDYVIRFVFTTKAGMPAALAAAQDRAFVLECGDQSVDPDLVVQRLTESGYKNLLVEGGGEVMSAFLAKDLLQELYVTLTPWIVGGRNNPTLVGGTTLLPWKKLKLMKSKRIKDEIYLLYKCVKVRRLVSGKGLR